MCKIEISREDKWRRDSRRRYRIILDNKEVGRIKAGELISLDVKPGSHQLELRIDYGTSPILNFEATDGETIKFGCEPLGGDAGVTAILDASIDLWRIPSGFEDPRS